MVIAASGNLYIGGSRTIFALTPDGKLRWSKKLPRPIYVPPAISADEKSIYVPCLDSKLHAFASDGTRKWSFLMQASSLVSPVVLPDGRVCVITTRGVLTALRDRP